jgi:hypothetical protein
MRIPGINFGSVLKKQLDGGLIARQGNRDKGNRDKGQP